LKKERKRSLKTALIIVLSAVLIVLSFNQYRDLLHQSFETEIQADLSTDARQSVYLVSEKFKAVVSSMNALSQTISNQNIPLADKNVFALLNEVKKTNGLTTMAVALPDGTCLLDNGNKLQIADRAYFQKSMANSIAVSDLTKSKLDGSSCLIIAVPVCRNSEVIGSINTILPTKVMNEFLQTKVPQEQGIICIINQNGEIIATTKPQYDYSSIFREADLSAEKKEEIDRAKADIKNGKSGNVNYDLDKIKYLAHYEPIGMNGWYLIKAVPANTIFVKSNLFLGYTGLLAVKLIGIMLLLGAYTVICEKRNKKELKEINDQLIRTKTELETFVADLPGGAFRYTADETAKFEFVSEGLLKLFGYTKEEFEQKFENSFHNMIYEEDRSRTLNSICEQVEKGRTAEVKFRVVTADGGIRWMLNRTQIVTDVSGHKEFCAVVVDITNSKKAHKRARDAMTQLETLSNSIAGGVAQFLYNENLTLVYASEGFYKLSGYDKEEYEQMADGEGIWHAHPDDLHHLKNLVDKQIKEHQPISAEYRLLRKNGSIIWISLSGTRTVSSQGNVIYQCIFTDITSFKNTQQELELEKERYEIAENLSDDILFEYDIGSDYIELSPLFTALTGRYPRVSNFSKDIYKDEIIPSDDLPAMKNFLQEIKLGQSENGVEFRLKTRSGDYIWHRVKAKIIYDANGQPSKMIGKAYNIDAQKKEMQRLTDKSQRDPLTNLYNKIATQSQIEDDLKEAQAGSRHALMMIDIDDFKSINDNFGHMAGDVVITEISASLQMLFRTSDVVGRIGGDEFIVFLRDISTDQMIAKKAKAICDIFRNTREGSRLNYQISGSIGIALYPDDGTTYQELFPKADLALYRAKSMGKDCYTFYNDELHVNSPK
jgi:diguanylate cyclase (GGDEF)-like protein/PAS domain S-box-containing protein